MSNKQNDALNDQILETQQELILSCRKAMWWGDGTPAGLCGKPAYGPGTGDFSYVGTCCRNHGGPDAPDGVVVEKDGNAWCAHYDNFLNLQESDAEFGDTPDEAIENLLKKHIKP